MVRPLDVPARMITITIGGATLGGSGKTRVALACVRQLARAGCNVVLIGHAYGAKPLTARIVTAGDALADVGDEALACARSLPTARVVVGPTRQAAIDFVATLVPHVDAVVIDGPLQLSPVRSSLSILALDADAPWGAGAMPPAGDLRAPRRALLAHADHVVSVDATPRAAVLDGQHLDVATLAASLASARIGLFTAIGRPDRLERALERVGLAPRVVVHAGDHGPMTARISRLLGAAEVDVWLATEKCALHLEGLDLAHPLAILDGSTLLPRPIRDALAHAATHVGEVPTWGALTL